MSLLLCAKDCEKFSLIVSTVQLFSTPQSLALCLSPRRKLHVQPWKLFPQHHSKSTLSQVRSAQAKQQQKIQANKLIPSHVSIGAANASERTFNMTGQFYSCGWGDGGSGRDAFPSQKPGPNSGSCRLVDLFCVSKWIRTANTLPIQSIESH